MLIALLVRCCNKNLTLRAHNRWSCFWLKFDTASCFPQGQRICGYHAHDDDRSFAECHSMVSLLFPEVSLAEINNQFSVSNTVLQLSPTPLFQAETPDDPMIGGNQKLSTTPRTWTKLADNNINRKWIPCRASQHNTTIRWTRSCRGRSKLRMLFSEKHFKYKGRYWHFSGNAHLVSTRNEWWIQRGTQGLPTANNLLTMLSSDSLD